MKTTMKITIVAVNLLCTLVSGFLAPIERTPFRLTRDTNQFVSSLSMAGFGGSGSSKKVSKKGSNVSTLKLKPKTQWDKYKNLKTASRIEVAVRVANEGSEATEWFHVGTIKSEEDEFTEAAVVLQKGIITEHAKRLYPLQVLPKDRVQWAYASNNDSDDWIAIDEKAAASPGTEKKIGFQGDADPTGYYAKVGSRGYDGVAAKKDRGF